MRTAAASGVSLSYFLLLLMGRTAYCQLSTSDEDLTPPTGNSPKMVVKADSAYQVYTCVNGAWTLGTGYAKLVDKTTNKVVGNYTSWADKVGQVAAFTIFNSVGDSNEGGNGASVVRGRPIASSGVGNSSSAMLLEAESHDHFGSASTVAYIQVYNIEGNVAPAKEKCAVKDEGSSVTVPFTAELCLFTQDPLPATVPAQLKSPGRLVDGFYGKGDIVFKFDGSAWVEARREGKLYSLPGNPEIGQFWEKDGVQSWQIYDPNGFHVYAKLRAPAMWVSKTSCPWTLSVITSTPSSTWSVGNCTNVQTTSTRGGLSPTDTSQAIVGAETKVEFSAIYWFYTNSFPAVTTTS